MSEIENPGSHEHFTFLVAPRDPHAPLFSVEVSAPPTMAPPPVHRHLHQRERFEVLEGEIELTIEGRNATLKVGESAEVAPGTRHTWKNSGSGTVRVLNEFRPAGGMQSFFETFCGLAQEGRSDAQGQPPLLQAAISMPIWQMYLGGPPILAQRILLSLLRPVARFRGYRARYPRFESD